MVALNEVIASNERVASTFPPGLVALFVGGTSGVSEYTVKAFSRYDRFQEDHGDRSRSIEYLTEEVVEDKY
ncbi:hypothetical protein V1515DRAFT_596924 [Lipomyces mesembrius]